MENIKSTIHFDIIVNHLNRKKPILTKTHGKASTEWIVSKPIIEITNDDCSLYCFYGKHYLYIHYDEEKVFNPYEVSIESQCVFARRQEIGTKFYDDVAPTQEDVVECIRYRLRK